MLKISDTQLYNYLFILSIAIIFFTRNITKKTKVEISYLFTKYSSKYDQMLICFMKETEWEKKREKKIVLLRWIVESLFLKTVSDTEWGGGGYQETAHPQVASLTPWTKPNLKKGNFSSYIAPPLQGPLLVTIIYNQTSSRDGAML